MTQQKHTYLADEEPNKNIKAARIFDHQQDEPEIQIVKPAIMVSDQDTVKLQDDLVTSSIEQEPVMPAKKPSKKWRWILLTAILFASGIELALFIRAVFARTDWLAGVWLVVFLVLTVLLIKWLAVEYRGLKQLKRQNHIRNQSKKMSDTEVIGRAEQHCLEIAQTLPEHCQPMVEKWQKSVESHHNDKEILTLFEHKVIAKVDQLAMQQVSKNASAASVMIAVSPFALVDMLIVLWRNIHMMNQISEIYGLHLGYWARIRLIRNIFHTMLFAGAAEILSDAGNYALGTSITGKLSTRVAQGLGAGILTARIGLKAINESRPLPWLSVQKPGLSGISKQLMSDLQKQLS